jgi:polyhydroxyalkanoate synthesis repressor PhaR
MSEPSDREQPTTSERRVIKRYSNRKLYDTRDSRYVTLLEIAELVRAGEDVQVIDNSTKEDKTDVTLALIISEELKTRPKGIPLNTLRSLIFEHGERLLNQLRDVPIKKLVPWESDAPPVQSDASNSAADVENDAARSEPPISEAARKSSPSSATLSASASTTARSIRATLEQWQQTMDERIRAVVPNFSAVSDLEREVRQLKERMAALEARIGPLAASADGDHRRAPSDSQE